MSADLNILVAYPYVASSYAYRVMDEAGAHGGVCWLLDSGAFSAWKIGKPVRLDDYCAFLRELPRAPWRYIALDVIGDGDATWRNYLTMRERGFDPVPVFTRGEDLAVLDRYYETSDLVAIGGLVSAVSDPRPYLKLLHERLSGRKYHLLGFSNLDWLKYLRPYSVDSSTWSLGRRYGRLDVYMGRGRFQKLSQKTWEKDATEEVRARVRAMGIDPALLYRQDSWRGSASVLERVTVTSWMWFAIDIERALGTRLFLAHSASSSAPYFAPCFAAARRAAGLGMAADEGKGAA